MFSLSLIRLFSFLRYIRLKLLAVILRVSIRLRLGAPNAKPDEVIDINSRNPGRKIKIHVYKPAKARKPAPVLINLHGSGFIIPLHGIDDEFCRKVSQEAGYIVLDVPYRLGPENPFPAALDDVEDAVNWVLQQQENYNHERVAVSGFSAGGTLALVAASTIFPRGTFHSLIAFYPPTDLSIDPGLKTAPDASGKPISPFMANIFNKCYVPPTVDLKDPRVSPTFASTEAFPDNVLIVTAARDTLAFEAEELAARLENESGRHVTHRRMKGCDHGWDKAAKEGTIQADARDQAYGLAMQQLRL